VRGEPRSPPAHVLSGLAVELAPRTSRRRTRYARMVIRSDAAGRGGEPGRRSAADFRCPFALQPRRLGGGAAQGCDRAAEEGRRAPRAGVELERRRSTQKLYAEAPEIIIRSCAPTAAAARSATWFSDPTIITHLEDRLKRYKYVAIGEFTSTAPMPTLPVPRRMVELAREYKLFLHAHSDADAIERLFRQDPNARILWAHSGFDQPARVREMLRRHKNLYADLAFRSDHGSGGKVDADWRAAFMEFPDRFMVGTDTFAPERWHYVVEHAEWSRRLAGRHAARRRREDRLQERRGDLRQADPR